MFDLPMNESEERKKYAKFRKWLLSNGYVMMQYSIYCKLFNHAEAVENHRKNLKDQIPNDGHIRIMSITEKQYVSIEILIGGLSIKEKDMDVNPLVIL